MFCERCHRRYESDHRFCPHDGAALVERLDPTKFPQRSTRIAGAIFGERYEVRGFIGKGAMARVYLATDTQTGASVAVKVLEAQHTKVPRTKARFIQEAKAAAMIEHPNIVKVLDIGLREDGSPYLVMEYLFGEPLGDLLRRDRVLTQKVGLPIIRQIACGLQAAHAVKIIHRDVKPDNIFLVGEPGASYGVKVVDFGFAKLVEQHGGITQAGVAVGTVEYMAPEQVVSDTPDPRTDVYGLGVVMFRMFSGRLPFTAKEDPDLLAKQLLEPPPPAALDPDVDAVIHKALKKSPDLRYASMGDMIADFDRLLAGERAEARLADRAEDVYVPKTKFAESAARFLYKRMRLTPPEW